MKNLDLNCICGAYWGGLLPESEAEAIKIVWRVTHSGPGHAPCDAETARRNRREFEAEEAASEKGKP